jgi:hypothetical protein
MSVAACCKRAGRFRKAKGKGKKEKVRMKSMLLRLLLLPFAFLLLPSSTARSQQAATDLMLCLRQLNPQRRRRLR